MTKECWRPIIGFVGLYEVSDGGRVRSLDHETTAIYHGTQATRKFKGRVLKTKPRPKDNYLQVSLCDGHGGYAKRLVHHLVAEAFIGPRPDGLFVLHRDGQGANCRLNNIYYGDQVENMADCRRHGTMVTGSRHFRAKLTERQVERILLSRGKSDSEIAREIGVSHSNVSYIRRRETWKHVLPHLTAMDTR